MKIEEILLGNTEIERRNRTTDLTAAERAAQIAAIAMINSHVDHASLIPHLEIVNRNNIPDCKKHFLQIFNKEGYYGYVNYATENGKSVELCCYDEINELAYYVVGRSDNEDFDYTEFFCINSEGEICSTSSCPITHLELKNGKIECYTDRFNGENPLDIGHIMLDESSKNAKVKKEILNEPVQDLTIQEIALKIQKDRLVNDEYYIILFQKFDNDKNFINKDGLCKIFLNTMRDYLTNHPKIVDTEIGALIYDLCAYALQNGLKDIIKENYPIIRKRYISLKRQFK